MNFTEQDTRWDSAEAELWELRMALRRGADPVAMRRDLERQIRLIAEAEKLESK